MQTDLELVTNKNSKHAFDLPMKKLPLGPYEVLLACICNIVYIQQFKLKKTLAWHLLDNATTS